MMALDLEESGWSPADGPVHVIIKYMYIITLVNVNAPVVATTSWWLHFSAQVVA